MRQIFHGLCSLLVFLSSVPVTDGGELRQADLAADLSSEDPLRRQEAQKELRAERSGLVAALLETIERDDAPLDFFSPTTLSIELLGSLRAAEAVPYLARRMTFKPNQILDEWRPREYEFPAAVALSEIGFPAVPAMIANVRTSEDPMTRDLSAWVIERVVGPEMGKRVVRQAIEGEEDPELRKRLREALRRFDKRPLED